MDDGWIKDSRIRMDFLLSPGNVIISNLFSSTSVGRGRYGDAQRKDAGNGL